MGQISPLAFQTVRAVTGTTIPVMMKDSSKPARIVIRSDTAPNAAVAVSDSVTACLKAAADAPLSKPENHTLEDPKKDGPLLLNKPCPIINQEMMDAQTMASPCYTVRGLQQFSCQCIVMVSPILLAACFGLKSHTHAMMYRQHKRQTALTYLGVTTDYHLFTLWVIAHSHHDQRQMQNKNSAAVQDGLIRQRCITRTHSWHLHEWVRG